MSGANGSEALTGAPHHDGSNHPAEVRTAASLPERMAGESDYAFTLRNALFEKRFGKPSKPTATPTATQNSDDILGLGVSKGGSFLDDLDTPEAPKNTPIAKAPRAVPIDYKPDNSQALIIPRDVRDFNLRKPATERFEIIVNSLGKGTISAEFDEDGNSITKTHAVDLGTRIQMVLSNYNLDNFVANPKQVIDVRLEKNRIRIDYVNDQGQKSKATIDPDGVVRA